MFYKHTDQSVRLTGRWFSSENDCTTTANGSKIEIACKSDYIVLKFNTDDNTGRYPHLWICVDGGIKTEAVLSPYLRLEFDKSTHYIEVIMKSSSEAQSRWFSPIEAKVSFLGYDADKSAVLPKNNKKTIEFIGDSITEGVLIDSFQRSSDKECFDRPFQDDSTATYAYLTAKNLNLEPYIMGYGAVGVTKSGSGSVPPAPESYLYCFDKAPIPYANCDYIVINHGTNDGGNKEQFAENYRKLLEVVTKHNPKSKIAAMIPFIGLFHDEIIEVISSFNKENNTDIMVIDTTGWLPPQPLHPLRDGHKTATEKLTPILKEIFDL